MTLSGQIRSLFICLSDDQFSKRFGKFQRSGGAASRPAQAQAQETATAPDDSDSEGSQVLDPSSAQVPLPVPPPPVAMTPAASGSRGGRGSKRGASGDLSGAAKK